MIIKILLIISVTATLILCASPAASEQPRAELKAAIKYMLAPNPTGSQIIGAPEPVEMQAEWPAVK